MFDCGWKTSRYPRQVFLHTLKMYLSVQRAATHLRPVLVRHTHDVASSEPQQLQTAPHDGQQHFDTPEHSTVSPCRPTSCQLRRHCHHCLSATSGTLDGGWPQHVAWHRQRVWTSYVMTVTTTFGGDNCTHQPSEFPARRPLRLRHTSERPISSHAVKCPTNQKSDRQSKGLSLRQTVCN